MSDVTVVRLRTTNDSNGNPRRLLVADLGSDREAVVEEGYNGDGLRFIARAFGEFAHYNGTTIDITPGQYRTLLKQARQVH